LNSIRVPPGFEVSAAAKPGLVNYPMLGTIAPDGVMYMCESSGKTVKTPEMTADPTYVVTRLVDTDKDGVYDKSTVFADKLTLPAGAVWLKGSLYVAAPPVLWRLTDADGDGIAEKREEVVRGWNLSANAASLHGPILGPDGWLYLTDGRHGFDIKTVDGRQFKGKASRIWRVRPDGTGLETYAGGGFDNPVEVAFTDGGDMFGTMTYFQDPRDGQRDAILHFVEGGVYPKPYPVTEEFKRTGELMPVMTKFARIAPAGLLRYRGSAFGHGNLFTAQFNSHRVQRHKVSRNGATYQTEDEDFLVSSDPDLHPTDVMQDNDGSMVVVDTGAWFIHGCPLSRTAKVSERGSLYRVRKKDAKPETPKASPADGVFASFRAGTLADVEAALNHADYEARQAAARAAGMAGMKSAVPRLMEMVRKEDPSVRRQAAAALGQIGDKRAVPALIDAAANADDRFVEHSIIYALIQLGDSAPLLKQLKNENPRVRQTALIALDQMDKSPLVEGHVLPFLADSDADLRRSALWVVSRHKQWAGSVTKALESRLRSSDDAAPLGDAIVAFCAEAPMRKSIAAVLGDPGLDSARQSFLLEAAERCSAKEFPPEWQPGLAKLLAHKDARVRVEAIGLLRARGLSAFDADLTRLAGSTGERDDIRVAALSALGSRQASLDDASFKYLISRLLPAVDASAKLAAAQVLSRAQFTLAQLTEIASRHLKASDPIVLPNLIEAFRNGGDEATGKALVNALTNVELGSVGSQRVNEIVAKFPASVQESAKPLLARMEKGRETRLEKVRRLEPTLAAQGDVGKGKEIYFGAKAGCSSCHTIGLEGGHVGPDLTSIGAIRSPHDLLEAIVLPSESFVPGHEVYRVETAREMYSGVLGKSTPDAVRLITGPGDEVRIPRKEIIKMGHAPVSLMPEGFDEILNKRELTDLMAFLRAQTARP
jgi:putative membrane-bound dehydrogenase-like protein